MPPRPSRPTCRSCRSTSASPKRGTAKKPAKTIGPIPHHPRRERAIRVIRDYKPDLLGVQEARDGQIDDLQEALPEYEFYGVGRDDGKTAANSRASIIARIASRRRMQVRSG